MFKIYSQYFRNYKLNSLFLKLLLSFFLLIIIPIVILGYVSFYKSSSILEMQVKKMNLSSIENTRELVDEKIDGIHKIIYQNLSHPSIVIFQKAQNPLKGSEIIESNRINNLLRRIKGSSEMVEEIFIYFNQSRSIISTQSKFDTQTFFKRIYSFKEYDYNYWMKTLGEMNRMRFLKTGELVYSPLEGNDGVETVTLINSLPFGSPDPKCVFVVVLNEHKLRNIIGQSDLTSIGFTLIIDGDGQIITHTYGDRNLDGFKDSPIYQNILNSGKPKGYFSSEWMDERKIVIYTKSQVSNWYIVSVIPAQVIINQSSYIKKLTLYFGMGMLVLGLILSFLLSNRIYQPITRILDFIGESKIIQQDSQTDTKDEIALINTGLVKAVERNKSLEQYVEKNLPLLQERFFFRLAKGYFVDLDEISQRMNELEISMKGKFFTVNTIKVDNYLDVIEENPDVPFQHLRFYIKDVVEKHFEDCAEVFIFFDQQYIGVLVVHDWDEREARNRLGAVYEGIQQEVKEKMSFTISVGIGTAKAVMDEIPKSYDESVEALKTKFFYGKNQIRFYSKNEGSSEGVFYLPFGDEEKIINCIKNGDIAVVHRYLEKIVDYNVEMNQGNYEYINQLFRQLLGLAVRAIYEMGSSLEEVFGKNYNIYREFMRHESVPEVKAFLKKQYSIIGERLKEIMDEKNSIREPVMEYIKKHYNEDISLQMMAEQFNLSPGYFSRYFKEMTGSTLIDAVNSYRIVKAKKLLIDDRDRNIKDIAEEVGFNSYKTFARAFKKYTGVSPENYRKITEQEENAQ